MRAAPTTSGIASGCKHGVDLSDRKPHTALRARAGHLLVRGRSELACDRHGGLLGRLYESNLDGRGRRVIVRPAVVSVSFLEPERARWVARHDSPPRVER